MPDYVCNEKGDRFAIGTRAMLDRKVPGTVDGFYVDTRGILCVVFRADYRVSQTLYGLMPMTAEETPPQNTPVKLFSFTLILVHPSNLHPLEED